MLILKNVTAVQLHPAKVQEGVDIAIENDVIVAIGDALTQRYPDASYKEMHGRIVMPGIVCSHNHFTRDCPAELWQTSPLPGFHLNAEKSLVATRSRP